MHTRRVTNSSKKSEKKKGSKSFPKHTFSSPLSSQTSSTNNFKNKGANDKSPRLAKNIKVKYAFRTNSVYISLL